MKSLIKYSFLFLFINSTSAQSEYSKFNFSLGYGFPNIPKITAQVIENYADIKNFSSSGYGPIHFKAEFLPHKRFGIGLSLNHNQYKFKFEQDYFDSEQLKIIPNHLTFESKKTAINIRMNFHILDFENYENQDFYIGIGAGYNAGNNVIDSDIDVIPDIKFPSIFVFSVEGTLGYRHFYNNFGLYAELGYAKSLVQGGVIYRIN